jgi:hypothetical protein
MEMKRMATGLVYIPYWRKVRAFFPLGVFPQLYQHGNAGLNNLDDGDVRGGHYRSQFYWPLKRATWIFNARQKR